MESDYFKTQKVKGRWFESEVEKVLKEKGCEVIDSENLKYRDKKGWDREVRINGEKCKLEMKYDELSESTGNVCIELAALHQSISPIWIYGLPENGNLNLYSIFLKDLIPFAESYPVKKLVGEFNIPAALVPKYVFLAQPFVHKFKSLTTNQ
jgi:hypothetical protein